MKIVTGAIIEATIITIVEILAEGTLAEETSGTEILTETLAEGTQEETSETEILDVEILVEGTPAEETSETEILVEGTPAEETSETGIQGAGLGLEKRFLQIMIGLAQSVTTPIFFP